MRVVLFVVALLFAGYTPAQDKKADSTAKPPAAPTPNFCDVTYSVEIEDDDGNDVGYAANTIKASPYADVAEDHKRQLKVLDVLSKEQNKGGPYQITAAEVRTCDGGNTVRIAAGSIFVEGVTLEGNTKVTDMALKMADEINDRYKKRAKAGARQGWNHKNAKKVRRDDLGRRIHVRDRD